MVEVSLRRVSSLCGNSTETLLEDDGNTSRIYEKVCLVFEHNGRDLM